MSVNSTVGMALLGQVLVYQ